MIAEPIGTNMEMGTTLGSITSKFTKLLRGTNDDRTVEELAMRLRTHMIIGDKEIPLTEFSTKRKSCVEESKKILVSSNINKKGGRSQEHNTNDSSEDEDSLLDDSDFVIKEPEIKEKPGNNNYNYFRKVDKNGTVIPNVRLRYQDIDSYIKSLETLIKFEENESKQATRKLSQLVKNVQWKGEETKLEKAFFKIDPKRDYNTYMLVGSAVKLTFCVNQKKTDRFFSGFICKVPKDEKDSIGINIGSRELDFDAMLLLKGKKAVFLFEFVFDSSSFNRQKQALQMLKVEKSISKTIQKKLLGEKDGFEIKRGNISLYAPPGLAKMNPSQIEAVAQSLCKPLTLIQGPPGTGKTSTCAAIVYNLVKHTKKQVLVCAPSNVASDNLAERISRTGIKVIRICSVRHKLLTTVPLLCLHKKIGAMPTGKKGSKEYAKALRAYFARAGDVLNAADVICTTCCGASSSFTKSMKFENVLVDETTQAVEAEVLIPMVKGAKKVILVGDQKQLGPVVMSNQAGASGWQESLFDRLIALGNETHMLNIQYRMHPELSLFPNHAFYDGDLQDGISKEDRIMESIAFHKILPTMPSIFWTCDGHESNGEHGKSYYNDSEAKNVVVLLDHLLELGLKPQQIGVISPYKAQIGKINTILTTKLSQIEVSSVDAFQGREKDFIIVTCVRSNSKGRVGFLNDPRRMNVAITRAKYGMVIIGNPITLLKDNLWNHLLQSYMERDMVFKGDLKSLKKWDNIG